MIYREDLGLGLGNCFFVGGLPFEIGFCHGLTIEEKGDFLNCGRDVNKKQSRAEWRGECFTTTQTRLPAESNIRSAHDHSPMISSFARNSFPDSPYPTHHHCHVSYPRAPYLTIAFLTVPTTLQNHPNSSTHPPKLSHPPTISRSPPSLLPLYTPSSISILPPKKTLAQPITAITPSQPPFVSLLSILCEFRSSIPVKIVY